MFLFSFSLHLKYLGGESLFHPQSRVMFLKCILCIEFRALIFLDAGRQRPTLFLPFTWALTK